MPTTLLRTKLFIPPIPPELVSRPRLTERFEAGLHRKLTLVSAPAGFGKSTVLSEWAHQTAEGNCRSPVRIAWVSLDKDDNDPERFWTYLIASLGTVQEGLGATILPKLQTPNPPPVKSLLTPLINELADNMDRLCLVLDDYHVIDTESIHDAMRFLLDHIPPTMHLAIASRVEPPLPLARLRGKGQLNELGITDLRFTLNETQAFFNEAMKLGLSDENVAVLENRTEGWIASLQMAAISMQGREDIPDFIRTFSGSQRHILAYLTQEVLERQPADTQAFLLETSILDLVMIQ